MESCPCASFHAAATPRLTRVNPQSFIRCSSSRITSGPIVKQGLSSAAVGLRTSLLLPRLHSTRSPQIARPTLFASPREHSLHVVRAGRGDDVIDAGDRIIAAAGYLLPFLDGVKYGRYLYLQYPFARALLDPIVPLVQLYNGVPFAGFVAFFALYLLVIQNPSMSRYVRFNVMQAVILDILMILPALFERLLNFSDGVGLQLTIIFYNTVFLYLLACFLFGVGSCLLGKSPRLPIVADAAEAQVPF